jgi:dihydroxyacetone kinase-like protein
MSTAAAGKQELTLAECAAMWKAGVGGVIQRGKAGPGDKTMVDTLVPALSALNDAIAAGATLSDALVSFQAAAEQGMQATIPLVARKGRASYLGERSAGHQDPGATSSYLLIQAAAQAWIPRVPT